jgi:hypothetical protein
MRGTVSVAIALLAALAGAHTVAQEVPAAARSWSFDSDKAGAAPAGFVFDKSTAGKPGRWVVKQEPGAPSGTQVLAQNDADDTDDRFLMAVAQEPSLRDIALSVRCKAVSGKVDQACGLVFRYRDAKNYYVTRANALEGNVRLYTVKDGRRKQLASWDGKVAADVWHELRVDAQREHIVVSWNGAKVIDERDKTFLDAGRVGVWTKADSVTYFDGLNVAPSAKP